MTASNNPGRKLRCTVVELGPVMAPTGKFPSAMTTWAKCPERAKASNIVGCITAVFNIKIVLKIIILTSPLAVIQFV